MNDQRNDVRTVRYFNDHMAHSAHRALPWTGGLLREQPYASRSEDRSTERRCVLLRYTLVDAYPSVSMEQRNEPVFLPRLP